jgi:CRP-like cAMP-binding protein
MPQVMQPADEPGSIALFADLSRAQLEAVAHSFEEVWFGEGERILREGLSGTGFYVILDGEAAIRAGGREAAVLGRGDFFGEVSALLGELPSADVVATTRRP